MQRLLRVDGFLVFRVPAVEGGVFPFGVVDIQIRKALALFRFQRDGSSFSSVTSVRV